MVRSVVLDEDGAAAAVVGSQVLQEAQVGVGIEHGVLPVMEVGAVDLHGAENLHAFALTGDENLRGAADPTPRGVECGILPEAGLVGEDQRPLFALGFFLRLG